MSTDQTARGRKPYRPRRAPGTAGRASGPPPSAGPGMPRARRARPTQAPAQPAGDRYPPYRWRSASSRLSCCSASRSTFSSHPSVRYRGIPPGKRLHYFVAPLATSHLNGDANVTRQRSLTRTPPGVERVPAGQRAPLVLAFFVTGSNHRAGDRHAAGSPAVSRHGTPTSPRSRSTQPRTPPPSSCGPPLDDPGRVRRRRRVGGYTASPTARWSSWRIVAASSPSG